MSPGAIAADGEKQPAPPTGMEVSRYSMPVIIANPGRSALVRAHASVNDCMS